MTLNSGDEPVKCWCNGAPTVSHPRERSGPVSTPEPERNPFLPAKPTDGQHSFQGPADLGGNSRCTFCGAYQCSVEGDAECGGEFKQSSKMRAWAADRWRESLAASGPVDQAVAAPASPVPAEQPESKPCNCADFPGLAGEHSPWCGNTTGPRFSITGALPPAEQLEER